VQTRLGSWLEAWAGIVIGFGLNWLINIYVLPLYGVHMSGHQAFSIGIMFTLVSLCRSYALRRIFNRIRRFHHAPK
jgi:hypothetical protein